MCYKTGHIMCYLQLPTTGIPYVLVNGVVVVKDSKVQKGVYPGQPIRFPVMEKGFLEEIDLQPRDFVPKQGN